MSILTCTNVHPSNEVINVNPSYYTGQELEEIRKLHPEYDDLPDTSPVFYKDPAMFSFQFNCSGGTGCLRFFTTKYTNVKTGESFSSHAPRNSTYAAGGNEYSNGDTLRFTDGLFMSKAKNGTDWQYQRTLFQSDRTKGNGNSQPLYDMKFCQGKVALTESGNIKISTGISNLLNAAYVYSASGTYTDSVFGYYGDKKTIDGTEITIDGTNCQLVGGAKFEINGNESLILQYDKKTGELKLQTGVGKVKEGDKFVIYTNYFIDRPHYVAVRSVPLKEYSMSNIHSNRRDYSRGEYSVSYTASSSGYTTIIKCNNGLIDDKLVDTIARRRKNDFDVIALHCACKYKQNSSNQHDYSPLKYYQYSLYEGINEGGTIVKGDLIAEGEEVYDDDVCYDFYVPVMNKDYVAIGRIVTQENAVYEDRFTGRFNSSGSQLPIVSGSFSTKLSYDKSHITIKWKWSESVKGRVAVYRRNKLGTDDWSQWTVIKLTDIFNKSAGEYENIDDYTIGSDLEYQYMIQYMYISDDSRSTSGSTITISNSVRYYEPYITPTVKHHWAETTITSLKAKSDVYYKKYAYTPEETWNFISQPDSNEILQNLGINVYDTTNGMPLTTRINKEYESSSFSLDLFQLNCPDGSIRDDISLVKKWVKFINADNDFLLKTPKGDVWIVEISGSPSRNYEYGSDTILTKINYDWVQVARTEEVDIS